LLPVAEQAGSNWNPHHTWFAPALRRHEWATALYSAAEFCGAAISSGMEDGGAGRYDRLAGLLSSADARAMKKRSNRGLERRCLS
jgi:hypothetical protein